MSKLIYLAGPIQGLSYNACTEWRQYMIDELRKEGIIGLSPMRARDFLKQHKGLLLPGISNHILDTDGAITTRDKWDVKRSDAVFFNLLKAKRISIGTMIEYGWASAYDKPIIAVMEKEKNVHEHTMIRRLSAYRVETLDEGLSVAKALFAY